MKLDPSPGNAEAFPDPQRRARADLMLVGGLALLFCFIIVRDPDRAFVWISLHDQMWADEFGTAALVLGAAFSVFSWRRWLDLSRQMTEYKRLQVELTRVRREAALLNETDDLLHSCVSVGEAYRIVARHFEAQLPNMSGAIYILAADQDRLEMATEWGRPAAGGTGFSINDCWAMRRGRVVVSDAADSKPACRHIGPTPPALALCIPMMANGETLGVLYLDSGSGGAQGQVPSLTEADQRTALTVAEHLSLALANLNLRERLRTQSIRDPLTGLFNRRYMDECLDRELRRAVRHRSSLSLLMIDVDHFKKFNDSWGHEAGDAVLRELASAMQSNLRAEDIACRYGGEEFLIVLPETDLQTAQILAERLRAAAHAMKVQHYGKVLEGLTLSAGIAAHPQHGAQVEALLQSADAALYQAKAGGRDRAALAERA